MLGDTTFTRGGMGTKGSFIKLGGGTLTFAGPYEYSFGLSCHCSWLGGDSPDVKWFADDGTSRVSYNPFTVANGRLVVGAPGQRFIARGELWIGTSTTAEAGKETTGECVFNVYGGTIEVKKNVVYVANCGGQGTLNLAGGAKIDTSLYAGEKIALAQTLV